MDYEKSYHNMDEIRLNSLKTRDALGYYYACRDMGIAPECVEDLDLYELGAAEIESRAKIRRESYKNNLSYPLERVVEVVFSPLSANGKISNSELKRRLSTLRHLNYRTYRYSGCSKKVNLDSFLIDREIILKVAEELIPSFLQKLREKYYRQKSLNLN